MARYVLSYLQQLVSEFVSLIYFFFCQQKLLRKQRPRVVKIKVGGVSFGYLYKCFIFLQFHRVPGSRSSHATLLSNVGKFLTICWKMLVILQVHVMYRCRCASFTNTPAKIYRGVYLNLRDINVLVLYVSDNLILSLRG